MICSVNFTLPEHPCVGERVFAILPVSNPNLEFHMGNLFTRNSWRAPLQLIDCWLPLPANGHVSKRPAAKVLHLFNRAGWLQPATRTARPDFITPSGHTSASRNTWMPMRLAAAPARGVSIHKNISINCNRVVISGRIADVCAELDRLVAQESQDTAPVA